MKFLSPISLLFILLSTFTIYAQQPTDCVNSITVCGNSEINLDVNGIGIQELNGLNNCGSRENNSLWLKVTLVTDGTLGFILTPESTSIIEDYDFFVFGPNQSCNNLSQAIRCSTTNPQAANQGNNLTGMTDLAVFEASEGPGQDGDSFVSWLNVMAGETYYIVIDRPVGNSAFNLEWIGTAQFASPPTNESGSSTALNLEACDVNTPFDDGFTNFDLSQNDAVIIGSQNNVSVSYFETESDANINTNAINGLYTNISNPQEIFARLTNTVTGCFEIIPFSLTVNQGPDFVNPTDYELCDTYDDGNNSNGQVVFNLATKNTEILDGQNQSDFNISYHESFPEADGNINPLNDNAYYNTTANLQEIFVRIESATNNNCFSITSLNLVVLETPEVFNDMQIQCSETNTSLYDLTSSNSTLTGGLTNVSSLFYESFNEALTGINQIQNPETYSSLSNPQIIYAKIINDQTGCFSIAELELQISTTAVNNAQIINCDDDGTEDGFYAFDLTEVEPDILMGTPTGSNIVYYESINDALLEINPLYNTYTNTQEYNQIIFARVENANQCYDIAEVELIVNTLPEIETEATVYYCLNTYPNTITIDSGNLNTLNNYSFLWSSGETTSVIDINEVGIYTVEITDINTNCSKTRTVTVEPSNIATVDSINIIDATVDNSITIITSGEGEYEFALFNETGLAYPYQSNNSFTNIIPGIYTLKIRDVKNNCGIIEDTISVIGFPRFFTPNGDGDNDYWNIKGVSNIIQPNSKILIFDRYGKLLKQLNPLSQGWDGTLNGEILPVSDYWFAITLQDGRIVKNHFSLKR